MNSEMRMDLPVLYDKIRRALAHVLVLKDGEAISKGSGFCFLPTGEILTAAHTAVGGFPAREEDWADKARTIIVRFVLQDKMLRYKIAVCPVEIHHSAAGMKPLQLDIAILVPVEVQQNSFEYLPASVKPPQLGEELFFAGYSDEIEFPFGADRLVPSSAIGIDAFRKEYSYGIKQIVSGPMIKRGVVGNAIQLTAKGSLASINVTAFYLDNQIHFGASGGPIVAHDGSAKGIIVKRAMTSTDSKEGDSIPVPSGSTMGMALDILAAMAHLQR